MVPMYCEGMAQKGADGASRPGQMRTTHAGTSPCCILPTPWLVVKQEGPCNSHTTLTTHLLQVRLATGTAVFWNNSTPTRLAKEINDAPTSTDEGVFFLAFFFVFWILISHSEKET